MKISYQYFEDKKLFIQSFDGFFEIKEYIAYTRFITQKLIDVPLNIVLIDFRKMDYSQIPDDFLEGVEKMTNVRRNITEQQIKRKDIKHIFWVDSPLPTVIVKLFIQSMPDLEINHSSTPESVEEYLLRYGCPIDDIESFAKDLKETFSEE